MRHSLEWSRMTDPKSLLRETADKIGLIEQELRILRESAQIAAGVEGPARSPGSAAVQTRPQQPEKLGLDGRVGDPYGTAASQVLLSARLSIQILSHNVVDLFYSTLMTHRDAKVVLDLLSLPEMEHLKEMQIRYLSSILAPGLSKTEHESMAKETGLRHAMMGVSPAALAEAISLYRHAIDRTFDSGDIGDSGTRSLGDVVIERLSNDLSWQLVAFSTLEQDRAHLTREFLEIFAARSNREDLLQEMLDRIVRIPGISGASIASFPNRDQIQCEMVAGTVLNGLECLRNHFLQPVDKKSLARKAFLEERPVLLNSTHSEELSPEDQAESRLLAIRSMAAWPILSQDGVPVAILNLYSKWPGFFRSDSQHLFWDFLTRSLGTALSSLRKISPSRTFRSISLTENQRFRALLNDGALEMWYQPVVHPLTRKIVKFEALARLRDGEEILVPGRFLPALGSSLLLHLFDLGLDQIRRDFADNPCFGGVVPSPRVSLNFPVEGFSNKRFMDRLIKASQGRSSGDSSLEITLEILETGYLDEVTAQKKIQLLKEAGFLIAIDDVGTGDSSLRRLMSLPIDEIKIDQSFVRSLEKKPENLGIILSLVDLATGLGLDYVLEGVENARIFDMLSIVGPRGMLQGYAIGRPMPHSALSSWCESWNAPSDIIHPWSLQGWFAQHEIRYRYISLFLSRGAWEVLLTESLADPDRCPLNETLTRLRISERLRDKVDVLHREFHGQIRRLMEESHMSTTGFQEAFREILARYQSMIVSLFPEAETPPGALP